MTNDPNKSGKRDVAPRYSDPSVLSERSCLGIRCGIYKPDIVNASSYTVCWHGVVSPYVCTSGAKVYW
jgi:hypothetical protein